MTCAQAWMEAALMRQDGVQRYVVYDECWRLMRFAGLVRRLSAQQKLARQWGCANALVAHRISDLLSASPDSIEVAKGLLAETAIRILYKQASDQVSATKEQLDLTDVAADMLPRLDPGFALWLIGARAFYVEHIVGDLEIPVVLNGSKMHGIVDNTNLYPEDIGLGGFDAFAPVGQLPPAGYDAAAYGPGYDGPGYDGPGYDGPGYDDGGYPGGGYPNDGSPAYDPLGHPAP
jgi:hypothetical protein